MKFSESWLREWVDLDISNEELTHQITMAGLEVDDVINVASDFYGVVIGEVLTCKQHPDADKLRVTTIDVKEAEPLTIVCGAPNCRTGLKVAVAKVGALLPNDFKIKEASLRGQLSMGMLCSFSELGIDIESDGIIELPLDAPIGVDVREYLKLEDKVIDVDLTANRADCLSIRGLAREVAVLNKKVVKDISFEKVKPTIDTVIKVEVNAKEAAPRYLCRVIKSLDRSKGTPLWLQEKLRRSGIRSIDPIVDVTNFVLLELGQPMHAFDFTKVDGSINIRFAKKGEELVLLDTTKIVLDDDIVVISDKTKALALAGIFGGADSGVSANTTDIILESAFFAPLAISGKARKFGLHTDSSHRFERGVDPYIQMLALERATQLIIDICGGECGPVEEASSDVHIPKVNEILLRREKLDKLLGISIPSNDVESILELLGFKVKSKEDDWFITSASYRFDINIEEDLIEEVARIYGYNNIPNASPITALKMLDHKEEILSLNKIRATLLAKGYNEAITYSFVDPNLQKRLHTDIEPMVLPNPISIEMSAMRLSLWTGLLNAVSYNQNRQQQRVRLFETGLRYTPNAEAEFKVKQEEVLAGVITGFANPEQWGISSKNADFFDLKGDLEALIGLTAAKSEFRFEACSHDALHPGQSAKISRLGEDIGFIGCLHPKHEKSFGLNSRVIIFEIKLDSLLKSNIPKASQISKFPAIRRDIAILVDEDVTMNNIVDIIQEATNNSLLDVNLFDIYQGQSVELGKKSMALSLRLQDVNKTLEEKEIKEIINHIIFLLESKINAVLRD